MRSFSFSNFIQTVGLDQYKKTLTKAIEEIELEFGVKSSLTISLYDRRMFFTSFCDSDAPDENKPATVLQSIDELNDSNWDDAVVVSTRIRPISEDSGYHCSVEAKGRHPRKISFYLSGDDEEGSDVGHTFDAIVERVQPTKVLKGFYSHHNGAGK